MKLILIVILLCLLSYLKTEAQCVCPMLPVGTNVTIVSSVTELQNALTLASQSNGNRTIVLNKGIYTLNNNLLYIGSHMKHLTIRGATGNRDDVIIKGQGMNGGVTHIFNVAASHFTLADLTIGWVFYHPIQIHGESNADSTWIRNVKIIDGNEQFIKISGSSIEQHTSDGGIIECCHFEFSAGIGNQYYTGGVDGHHCVNWLVRNNTFKHLRSPDGNLAEHAIHFWSQSKNIISENNLIINCDRGIGYGLGDDLARGNTGGIIRNNFIHTSRDVGIGIERSSNVKIYNNTVWTDNYFNSIEYRFTGTFNTHIANNLTNKNIALREGAQALLENNYTNATSNIFTNANSHDYHLNNAIPYLTAKGKVLSENQIDYDCIQRGLTNDIGADQFEIISSSEGLTSEKVMIYQNNHTLTIKQIDKYMESGEYTLFNIQGALLKSGKISTNKVLIDISNMQCGLYILNLNADQINTSHKLIIKP